MIGAFRRRPAAIVSLDEASTKLNDIIMTCNGFGYGVACVYVKTDGQADVFEDAKAACKASDIGANIVKLPLSATELIICVYLIRAVGACERIVRRIKDALSRRDPRAGGAIEMGVAIFDVHGRDGASLIEAARAGAFKLLGQGPARAIGAR